MKKIGVVINISDVWDKCRQWTTNRIFDHSNPNRSMEVLNYAYAMTEDERVQFFNDYFERVIRELSSDDLLLLLRRYNRISFGGRNIDIDWSRARATLYFVVGDYFPTENFHNMLTSYCQWKVLYYWYWEKNIREQTEWIVAHLDYVKSQIQTIANGEYDSDEGNMSQGNIPYNDGFIFNPPPKRKEIPSADEDTETVGVSDSPTDPDTPTPEPEPEKDEEWFFSQDFQNLMVLTDEQFSLQYALDRRVYTTAKSFQTLRIVVYNDEGRTVNAVAYMYRFIEQGQVQLPISKTINLRYTKDVTYYARAILIFEDGTEEVVAESTHCVVTMQNNSIYSEQYSEQYT